MVNLKSFLSVGVGVICAVMLSGCEDIETPTGEVPEAYVADAQKAMGVYRGKFDGITTTIILSMNGRKPVLTVHNEQGNDIIMDGCHSTIGQLNKIHVDEKKFKAAYFNFDPGSCNVQGRDVSVSFNEEKQQIYLRILHYTEWENSCVPSARVASTVIQDASADVPFPRVPGELPCRLEERRVYLTGTLIRMQ